MLPPYGACILGSLNLAALVKHPFTSHAYLDIRRLTALTHIAVRMLDNVNDVSNYPLEQQYVEAQSKRRIGLGITGFADMLIMLGLGYREAGPEWSQEVMRQISEAAMTASIDLATEKGAYPLWRAEHGPKRRNSHLLSIAPTGTISLFAGNVSSGIEPVFDFEYKRKVLEFCEAVQGRGFRWRVSARVDCVNPMMVEKMAEAVEKNSGDLAAIRKHVEQDR